MMRIDTSNYTARNRRGYDKSAAVHPYEGRQSRESHGITRNHTESHGITRDTTRLQRHTVAVHRGVVRAEQPPSATATADDVHHIEQA